MGERYLDSAMDNVLAWRLGEICMKAASPEQKVGDPIDRGLILLKLLEEKGFRLSVVPSATVGVRISSGIAHEQEPYTPSLPKETI